MRGIELTEEERRTRKARLTKQGERLAKLRKDAGLTQKELAEKIREAGGLAISTGLIKLIEIGERDLTPEKLRACAEIFRCRPGYITGETDYRDRAAELLEKLPEEDRVQMEGRAAVWRAAEQWIRASLPGEDLEELEAQGKINLFEIFCGVTECVQDAILKAKLPADLRERVEKKGLDLCEITCDPDQK